LLDLRHDVSSSGSLASPGRARKDDGCLLLQYGPAHEVERDQERAGGDEPPGEVAVEPALAAPPAAAALLDGPRHGAGLHHLPHPDRDHDPEEARDPEEDAEHAPRPEGEQPRAPALRLGGEAERLVRHQERRREGEADRDTDGPPPEAPRAAHGSSGPSRASTRGRRARISGDSRRRRVRRSQAIPARRTMVPAAPASGPNDPPVHQSAPSSTASYRGVSKTRPLTGKSSRLAMTQ